MSAEKQLLNTAINAKNSAVAKATSQQDKANKYSVQQLMYPLDLMSEQYGGNYAVFYINAAMDSKLNPNNQQMALDPAIEKRDRPDIVAKPTSTSSLTGSSAVINTLTGLIGGSILGKGLKGAVTGAAVANLPTVGVAVAGSTAPNTTRSSRRTVTTIALHVPNQLSVRYNMTWTEEDTATFSMAEEGVSQVLNALGKRSKSAVEGAVMSGADMITHKTLTGSQGGALSAKLGIAANPKKEQVFKGLDFRNFTFDYQFYPRSEKEAESVLKIVKQFKYHMHPEFKSANHFVWIYPSEFDIAYYHNGKENESLHKHTSCVLQDMNVNYTPNGSFNTFPNGMPTQINMQLTFRELILLNKDSIEKGL